MVPRMMRPLSDEERQEIVNLLHGAVARHTSPKNHVSDLWRGLIKKLEGPATLMVERQRE